VAIFCASLNRRFIALIRQADPQLHADPILSVDRQGLFAVGGALLWFVLQNITTGFSPLGGGPPSLGSASVVMSRAI
jgi:hypothetical protein